jgi:MtN3 and saliva related transmembrane protein
MQLADILACFAAVASTASFAPQAVKIIRTRKTKDISLWMYVLTVTGFALWTGFGALTSQWPLLAANVICLGLSAFILTMKILPDRKRPI